jgi:hypothetical protein
VPVVDDVMVAYDILLIINQLQNTVDIVTDQFDSIWDIFGERYEMGYYD